MEIEADIPEEEYITVHDKQGGRWLVIRMNDEGNDIIGQSKTKWWAEDIARAMNTMFGPGRDGLGLTMPSR